MTIRKLEIHNTNLSVTSVEFADDDHGRIPDNLVKITETVIQLLRANGDIAWLADMVADADNAGDRGEAWGHAGAMV